MFSNFFQKIVPITRYVEKYYRYRQTDRRRRYRAWHTLRRTIRHTFRHNFRHTLRHTFRRTLRHKLRIWHNYCFSRATVAIRMRLNFPFICTLPYPYPLSLIIVHCLSCFIIYLYEITFIKIYWFSSACKILDLYIIMLQKYKYYTRFLHFFYTLSHGLLY